MTAPGPRELRGPLSAAMALAAVAGFLDAHIYLKVVEVFVANMSGNIILLGMGVGDLSLPRVGGPAVALVLFGAGMAGATAMHDRRRRRGLRLRPDLLLAVEVALLTVVLVLLVVLGAEGRIGLPAAYPVLAVGALAMGIQTAAIRRVGATIVATTYESGAVARLAEESFLLGEETPRERRTSRSTLRILAAVVAAYAGGAAVATALGTSAWVLLVPLGVLAVVAVAAARGVLRDAADDDPGDEAADGPDGGADDAPP